MKVSQALPFRYIRTYQDLRCALSCVQKTSHGKKKHPTTSSVPRNSSFSPPPPLTWGLVARISSGATGKVEWNFRKSSGPSGWRVTSCCNTSWLDFQSQVFSNEVESTLKNWKNPSWVDLVGSNFAFKNVGWDEERDGEVGSRNRFFWGGTTVTIERKAGTLMIL